MRSTLAFKSVDIPMHQQAMRVWIVVVSLWIGVLSVNAEEVALSTISEEEFRQIGELMGELRKIQRDDLFVPVARLQLLYVDNLIKKTDPDATEDLQRLRKFARGVAFNIASFTWPGWGDTGPISAKAQELGYSAARVGLEYAIAVDDVTTNILWINGAHALAAKAYKNASSIFEQARDLAETEFDKSMHAAWISLTQFLESPSTERQAKFELAVSGVRDSDNEYAEFFASQLTTAVEIFSETSTASDQ